MLAQVSGSFLEVFCLSFFFVRTLVSRRRDPSRREGTPAQGWSSRCVGGGFALFSAPGWIHTPDTP